MQYNLNLIKKYLVNISDAIISVLGLDLTIVDNNLYRVVASGKYKNNIGERVSENSVFSYALKNRKSFIINKPKEHEACRQCSKRETCEEYAEICSPIKIGDTVIGVIGLIAFNQKQKDKILENDINILEFLDRMAEMIATKMIEEKNKRLLISQSAELEFLLDSVDSAIILISKDSKIIRFNKIAKEKFLDIEKNIKMSMIFKVFNNELFESKNITYNNELEHSNNRYLFTKKPIIDNGKVIEVILEIKEVKSIIDEVNEITGFNLAISFDDIIGKSKELKDIKRIAKIAAKSISTVLIQGESGSGKELFARAIHFESEVKNGPFVAINCAAIPESLLESELFGYVDGAFTGARKGGKIGKFELANRGTIFLDEIGELSIHIQSKLLRVIQEREIMRVGSNKLIDINARIVAATNRNLEKRIIDNQFREDLFYRLNVIPIKIPSLNERISDIEELSNFFLKKYNKNLNKKIEEIDKNVYTIFKKYNWKGNIRELENTIEYAVNMCSSIKITAFNLPNKFLNNDSEKEELKIDEIKSISRLEKEEILKAIKKYGDSPEGYKKCYRELDISRATFYRKVKKYSETEKN